MKTVTWIGPDRLIPPYGAASEGMELKLPDNIADSFCKQKLAKMKGGSKIYERTVKSTVKVEDK